MKQIILLVILIAFSESGYAQRNNNNATAGIKAHMRPSTTSNPKQSNSQKTTQKKQISTAHRVKASYANGTLTVNGINYSMVYVEGATFHMGATSEQGSDAESDEKPVHQVTLGNYYIGKYEVTQDLWQAVVGSNPSRFKGNRNPVEQVSWDDCQTFISKLNTLTGKHFRLPTEAEWEFASCGGTMNIGYKYSGSNTLDDVAWYAKNSNSTTHDVGTKNPNELGIYDMNGNVYEWCSDWYGDYSSNSQTNPTGANRGAFRVCRGGSWNYSARFCRVSNRDNGDPKGRYGDIGFRLLLSE